MKDVSRYLAWTRLNEDRERWRGRAVVAESKLNEKAKFQDWCKRIAELCDTPELREAEWYWTDEAWEAFAPMREALENPMKPMFPEDGREATLSQDRQYWRSRAILAEAKIALVEKVCDEAIVEPMDNAAWIATITLAGKVRRILESEKPPL